MISPSPSIEYLQHPNIYPQRQVANGKRLVIIAESTEGPLYEPVLVYHKDMARDFFGGGDLVRSYEDATVFQEGFPVFLMRIEPFGYDTAFSVLEAFHFDLLFLNEVRFKTKELMERYFEMCRTKEEKGNLIHGVVTLDPNLSFTEISSFFESIEELTRDYVDESEETGKYLSIVVNQIELKDAGAVYTGMLAHLDPQISPINKTIPDVTLTQEFSKEEILALRSAGVVCFKRTFKKGVTCTSSSCAVSTEGSVHKHISNFRIAQYLINQVALELQRFIGLTNPIFQTMNVEQIVESICLEHLALERLRDYGYSVTVNEVLGIINVKIEIVPIFSVHSITTHSRVRVFK